MKRPTIRDIAEHAGVSKGAVSFALNNRPGVSPQTRDRILAYADALGWYPNSAARALSAARSDLVGLVLARKPSVMSAESFFMELISGIEGELGPSEMGLVLKVVGEDPDRELAVYRQWSGQRRVDGVILVDIRVHDPRPAACEKAGLPALVLGRRTGDHRLPCLSVGIGAAMRAAVAHLAQFGHRRIARVAGPPAMVHTRDRDRAFRAAARRHGIESTMRARTDYTAEQGEQATRSLLTAPDRPTAIVYDNDLMAVRGVAVARELGLDVPGDLSVIAWEDSVLCRLMSPAMTSLRLDVAAYGATAAAMLTRLVAGDVVDDVAFPAPELVPRASTGQAPEGGDRARAGEARPG